MQPYKLLPRFLTYRLLIRYFQKIHNYTNSVGQSYEETDIRPPLQVLFFAACESAKFNATSSLSQKPATEQGEKYNVKYKLKSQNTCAEVYILYWIFMKRIWIKSKFC